MDFVNSGKLIREARNTAGLTQATLAARLHMSRATLSKVENGTIEELGIRKFARICEALNLELSVHPGRLPTLDEAYEQNRQEREAAFRETDMVLSKLNPSSLV
jgi:HTH-type transcriptional regulator / antitoxin HipB